jgi:pathogenesis-related protein 1
MIKKILLIFTLFSSGLSVYATDLVPNNLLTAHNAARQKVGSPNLAWSNKLQTRAQNWANELKKNGCGLKHSGSGENLYWASAKKIANSKDAQGEWVWVNTVQAITEQQVVDSWNSEKQWYAIETNECNAPSGKACGHYTQVVWKKTTEVGCAKAICDDATQVWVCNYSPAGNIVSEKPY